MPKPSALRRRIAPSVPLTIEFSDDGGQFRETYRVAFNLNVLAEINEKTGLSGLSFEIWTQLNASVLRAMLWASLLPNHPEFADVEGLEVVGSMLDGRNQEQVVAALWEAYLLYLPKDQADELRTQREKAEQKQADPLANSASPGASPKEPMVEDGSNSGPSPALIYGLPIAKSGS